MKYTYARIVVKGSPISKSNFKLSNLNGRAILPYSSGKYHDRYALYEEEIAYVARNQNPGVVLTESVVAVLMVFYKSSKRHPDTTNITKSIFDGIEKSGLIINDAQITKIIIEEFYDKENPRFELELYGESSYFIEYKISQKEIKDEPIDYSPPPNRKKSLNRVKNLKLDENQLCCELCGKIIDKDDFVSANKGKTIICKKCFKNSF